MADEDPFSAFGDDDSSSDHEEDTDEAKRARELLQAANAARNLPRETNSVTTAGKATVDDTVGISSSSDVVDLSNLEACNLPYWDDPLYMSSDVKLVSSLPFGGGRGLVAVSKLAPGTLVLVEEAIMMWPEEQLGKPLTLASVERLIHHDNAQKIISCLEDFHPSKAIVDAEFESESPDQVEKMMTLLQQQHQNNSLLDGLVQEAEALHLKNRDNSAISSDDILRLFLALRYNGLESGLYCYVAMINHHCQPNCVKFLPNKNDNASTDDTGNNDNDLPPTCSEVRTTRWINPGECLTISYLPKLVSHAFRRRHLWEQHRFDIGVQLAPDILRMEVVNGGFPPSSKEYADEDSITSRTERSLEEMEVLYQSTKDSLSSHSPSADMIELAKSLEVSSLELYSEAQRQLHNDNHILLIPCLILHLDACDLVLQADTKNTSTPILNHKQRCKLLGRMVATGMKLVDLQEALLGQHHFDVARTCLDLSHAIEELLSKSPDTLLQLETNRTDLKTFRDWSTLEYQYRKQHERIKDLYPRDAAKHISKQKI